MPKVELLYDRDCPNVAVARAHLLQAFVRAELTPKWSERLLGDGPAERHGSPTLLVDGRDVAGAATAGACCRLYLDEEGVLARAPSVSQVAAALARSRSRPRGWRASLAVLPGIGAALLPKVACPACWPAYAGFLSSLGLGFLMDATWLLPLTAVFLAIAVGALAQRARMRRRHGALVLGLVAAALVLLGKFVLELELAMYAGVALLVAASLWSSFAGRRSSDCPACVEEPT